jgi:hypothetical protein
VPRPYKENSQHIGMKNHSEPSSVPLATWMKMRLLYDCLPFIALIVVLLFTVVILPQIIGADVPAVLPLLLGVACLVLGFQAVQRLRDLTSGVTVVETDVLERSWRSGGRERKFFGKFERLGRMRLMPKAHFGSQNEVQYRVTYSPVSKIVWTLEKVG